MRQWAVGGEAVGGRQWAVGAGQWAAGVERCGVVALRRWAVRRPGGGRCGIEAMRRWAVRQWGGGC